MDDSAEIILEVDGEMAFWRQRPTHGIPVPAAYNDFVVGAALNLSRRNAAVQVSPLEVHLMHPRPVYANEYERYLDTKGSHSAPPITPPSYTSRGW